MIYLDHAATTPLDQGVLTAMQPYFAEHFYNPSATYLPARHVKDALQQARATVGRIIGCRTGEVVFTTGGTEGNNLAIQGVMRVFPDAKLLVSAVEHDSVLKPAELFDSQVVQVDEKGKLDLTDLRSKLDDRVVLVSVMYANNEVGTIQPMHEIANIVAEVKKQRLKDGNLLPLYLHTDACQAANYLDLQVSKLGVDMMTLNGGKIYGPKQTGVLYVSSQVKIRPLILGGGQEMGLRSGTENVAGAVGFAAALNKVQSKRHAESRRLGELQKSFFRDITDKSPEVVVNGSQKTRLPNNIHLTIPGTDNERLLIELEGAGFLLAAGSACSASSETPSHVLRAMGLSDEVARSSYRITMGQTTTAADLDSLLDALLEAK